MILFRTTGIMAVLAATCLLSCAESKSGSGTRLTGAGKSKKEESKSKDGAGAKAKTAATSKDKKIGTSGSAEATRENASGDDGTETDSIREIAIDPAEIMADYPKAYCESVSTLELSVNIKEELAFYCKDGAPTADLVDMRRRLMESANRRTVMQIIKAEHNEDTDISDFIVAWGYYIQKRPFDVKALPFYENVGRSLTEAEFSMSSTTTRRPDSELTSGLHLWSADVSYLLTVQATTDVSLNYIRNTQYNLYQVQSGNEEMGLGVETLTNPNEQNYLRSTMLNLSFNDGRGFNDGAGETLVFNVMRITLNNRGFPKSAAGAFDRMVNFLADSMYEGLAK